MSPMPARIAAWCEARYPVGAARDYLKRQAGKLLPPHTSWWHTFGSLLLFLTLNQIATGILLMVYYRAASETAFESMRFITEKAYFGWLIRGLHAWGANVMIVVLVVHMFRTYVMGTYKKPREMTWVVGVLIFGTVLTFGFTGYLLPWNQLSYWATVVGTAIVGSIPLIGQSLQYLLRGGEAVGGETLARFYVVHVAVLPWILVFLAGVHLILVRLHNLATLEPVGAERPVLARTGKRFFPEHVAKEGLAFSVFFAVLVAVILLFPPELGEPADPFQTPEHLKPEWYFLPTYQLLKYFPRLLGIAVSVLPMAALLVWPFFDRSPARHPGQRRGSAAIGVAALLLAVVFGTLGYLSERTITIFGSQVHFDIYGIPHEAPDSLAVAAVPAPTPGDQPQISLAAAVEEGRNMVVATVTLDGTPLEGAKLEFLTRQGSRLTAIGQDDTIEDGTAAVRIPEGLKGEADGQVEIIAEIRGPTQYAGARGTTRVPARVAAGPGDDEAPGRWEPRSLPALLIISGTVLAALLSSLVFYLKVRASSHA